MAGAWRRLPAYLPNIVLKPLPLSEAQYAAFEQTGTLKELAFKTAPSVSKVQRRRCGRRCARREAGAAPPVRLGKWQPVRQQKHTPLRWLSMCAAG